MTRMKGLSFQPFPLDLPESRRYIRHTLRQAVSFACSERPARQDPEIVAFSQDFAGANASTNEAQTLPLTADVRVLSEGKRCGRDGPRLIAVRTGERPPLAMRMARFRFARGNAIRKRVAGRGFDARERERRRRAWHGAGAKKDAGRQPPTSFRLDEPTEVAKANANDQPADCQAAAPAEGAQQGSGPAGVAAEARGLHARLHDDPEEAELGAAQGRQGTPDQRLRGDRLHPGRGP